VRNRRPAAMQPDEAVVYDFCTALHAEHAVDDALFARAVAALGEAGVIDLIGVSGYYGRWSSTSRTSSSPPGSGRRGRTRPLAGC
jgi:4-carboxymuconolactone decarboxylase